MRFFHGGFFIALLGLFPLFSLEDKVYYGSTIVPYCPKEGGRNNQEAPNNQSTDLYAPRNGDQKGDPSKNPPHMKHLLGLPEPSSTFYASCTYEYLKITQEGLPFALSADLRENVGITSAKVIHPKSPWKSALGINVGIVTTRNWTIDLAYTMVYNKNNDTQTVVTPAAPYTESTFLWNSLFNRVDLTLSRSCNLNPCLPFFPFVGLLLAFDNQSFKSNSVELVTQDYWKSKQDWWGVGPYLGGEFVFFLGENFLFLFRGGASIHLSSWNTYKDTTHTPDIESTLSPIPAYEAQVCDSYLSLRSMCDFMIGFRYQTDIIPGKPVFFQIDWRGELWPNHLLLFNYLFNSEIFPPTIVPAASFPTPSHLSIHGPAVTLGFSF